MNIDNVKIHPNHTDDTAEVAASVDKGTTESSLPTEDSHLGEQETNKRPRYHHGDLKSALLKAAEDILIELGSDGLTMRDLSKRVGVSRTAAYHHFRDKADLLSTLASEGFHHLSNALSDAMAEPGLNPKDRLESLMFSYVRYAADHPEKYRLMAGRDLWQEYPSPDLQKLAREAFRVYVGYITFFIDAGIIQSDNALRTAQVTWAMLHGVCRLLMDGIFARRSDMEDIIKHGIDMLTRPPPA